MHPSVRRVAPFAGRARPPRIAARAAAAVVCAAVVALGLAGLTSAPGRAETAAAPRDLLETPASAARAPERELMLDLARAGDDRLLAVGAFGRVLTSQDGGESWAQASTPVSVTLTAVAAQGDLAVAVGHDGVILRSRNGGARWDRVADGRSLFPGVLAAATARRDAAQAVVDRALDDAAREDAEYALDDEIFRMETAEQSLVDGPAWPLLDVLFLTESRVLAVGAYGLAFLSEDGGASWENVADRFDNPENLHLNAARVLGDQVAILGETGVAFTADRALAQVSPAVSPPAQSVFGVGALADAAGREALIAYGFGDSAWVSADGGARWDPLALGKSAILVGHVALGAGEIGLLGADGLLIRANRDGVLGETRPLGDRAFLTAGRLRPDGRLVIAGEAGVKLAEAAR